MNSRSIRVVALAIAIVTLVLCSLPAISFAADKATEIASRSMVTANDMQIASRGPSFDANGRSKCSFDANGRVSFDANGRVSFDANGRS